MGGLDNPADRDQWRWVFLNDPKNTLSPTENTKKYCPKSIVLKIPSWDAIDLVKVKHDMIIMKICFDLSTCWMKLDPKNTAGNLNTLKYSIYLTTPKSTGTVTSTSWKKYFHSKEQMKTTTREAREGKIKHIGWAFRRIYTGKIVLSPMIWRNFVVCLGFLRKEHSNTQKGYHGDSLVNDTCHGNFHGKISMAIVL